MQLVKALHQLIAFLLEIAMLITLSMWGFHGVKSTVAKWLPGLGLPILAAILWGILAAPKSSYRLDLPYRLLFSFTLFGITSFLLYRLGHTTLAILFIVLAVLSTLLELVFD
ncbi:YrdB family protein [Spirosoma pulveris]